MSIYYLLYIVRGMLKVFFLVALMSYPNVNAIHYKGLGGFTTQEECEEKRIIAENAITDMEIRRGHTVYIETYCLEFYVFPGVQNDDNKIDYHDAKGIAQEA
jgi:hypothetical protein